MSDSEQQQPNALPAGLELYYELEKSNVKTPLQAFVLALHWAVMRAGLRIRRTPTNGSTAVETTERLPEGWAHRVDQISRTPSSLDYVSQSKTNETYQIKIIEVAPNDTVVVTVYSPNAPASESTKDPRTSSASTYHIASFIRMPEANATPEAQTPHSIYYNASEMEKKIWSELLEPLGLRVMGQPPVPGPYDDKTKKETPQSQQIPDPGISGYERDYYGPPRRPSPIGPGGIGRPLFVPPAGGIGGLGRSDLDPLGGVGTGMIADPRGFRNPRIGPGGFQPGVPPGARFDPFGPPNPGAGPRPPGPAPGPNWGVPNPDHEQPPPGFEDMFM